MSTTKQSVDALVQGAIGNLRAGRTVEDDAGLELKRDWPEPATKARQLAAAANALGGEPLVYAIGVDDTSGAVTTPVRREVQDWYAQVSKQFDQGAPELMWCQTVYVGDDAESIQVLVFDTTGFPFVVKSSQDRLEVPYRRGTATRSARRSDLIRMLSARTRVPPMSVAEADVRISMRGNQSVGVRLDASLDVSIFVEQAIGEVATLPTRNMRARIVADDLHVPVPVTVRQLGDRGLMSFRRRGDPYPPEPNPPALGVYARDGIVVATAPGEFHISSGFIFEPEGEPRTVQNQRKVHDRKELLEVADELRVDLALKVVGVVGPIRLSIPVYRSTAEANEEAIGHWVFEEVADNPWQEGGEA